MPRIVSGSDPQERSTKSLGGVVSRSVDPFHRLGVGQGIVIFSVALFARTGVGLWQYYSKSDPTVLEFPDEQQYWTIATSIHSGEGFRDDLGFRASRMPLYPAYLALFASTPQGILWAKFGQWMLGAATSVMVASLASRVAGRRCATAAGLLVALDPFLVFLSSFLLVETFFVAALTGMWLMVWSLLAVGNHSKHPLRNWAIAGVMAAVCVYCREASLPLVVSALAAAAFIRRRDRCTIRGIILATIILATSLLPWAWRNRSILGEWCWLTTRAGISLYDGVRPGATGASDIGDIQRTPEVKTLSEVAWNRHFLKASVDAIRAEPSRILGLAGVKIKRMWNPVPNVENYRSNWIRWISACWALPIFLLAALGIVVLVSGFPRGVQTALFLTMPALYLTALHSLFVGSIRYRAPAIPMIEILAAIAMVRAWDYWIRHRATLNGKHLEPSTLH